MSRSTGTTAEINIISVDLDPAIRQALMDVANECVSTLEDLSPKDTGEYSMGWTWDWDGRDSVRIYNGGRQAPLTHLLELGHAVYIYSPKTNSFKVSHAAPIPHIKPAYLRTRGKYLDALEAAKDKINIYSQRYA